MRGDIRVGRCVRAALIGGLGLVWFAACGNDSESDDGGTTPPDRPEGTGAACEVAADCYAELEGQSIVGDAECLDRVRGGYCTHTCDADTDCCAVDGECGESVTQLCSPFENSTVTRCFVSCEAEDLFAPPDDPGAAVDEEEFCQRVASPDFICRSSGGGSDNRKICVPGNCGLGASCVDDADCGGGLDCIDAFAGGYCGRADCAADADCPDGSVCAVLGDGATYCLRTCAAASDCSFCRGDETPPACTDQVELVEATGVSVCQPLP
jgi:hypothetical protein